MKRRLWVFVYMFAVGMYLDLRDAWRARDLPRL